MLRVFSAAQPTPATGAIRRWWDKRLARPHSDGNQRSNAPRERGQSLIEFAFTLVIILLLLVGAIDLGRAIFTYLALRDAAQEGASYASYNPTDITGIQNRVRNASNTVNDLWVNPGVAVEVIHLGVPCSGNGVRVRVSLSNFTLVTPFLGAIVGSQTIPISASVTDTILVPPCP